MREYKVVVKEWHFPLDNVYEVMVEAKGPADACKKGNRKAKEMFNIDQITETIVEEI